MMAIHSNGTASISNGTDGGMHEDIQLALSVVSTAAGVLNVFSVSCAVEMKKLWGHIKRPWGITTGIMCQFGLMPLVAYILSSNISLNSIQILAVLIIGCSPGGSLSNVCTYWVDGDMDLSINMTFISNVSALGMMPLCLYIYASSWKFMDNVKVPYQNIGTTILALFMPATCGIFIRYRWPHKAPIFLKVGSTTGALCLIVVGLTAGVLYGNFKNVNVSFLMIATVLPASGYLGGFLLSLLTWHSWQRCRTISVETGTQNLYLINAVLQISFTFQQYIQMYQFIVFYSVCQILYLLFIISAYFIYKNILKKAMAVKRTYDLEMKM